MHALSNLEAYIHSSITFSLKGLLLNIKKTKEGLPHLMRTWKNPRPKLKAAILASSVLASPRYY